MRFHRLFWRISATSALSSLAIAMPAARAGACVVEIGNKDAFLASVPSFTSIDFVGFPKGTVMTDQYKDQGIVFLDGNDFVINSFGLYRDGAGIRSSPTPVWVEFARPQNWVALDFPGEVRVHLYQGAKLIHSSNWYLQSPFAGLISEEPFDKVMIEDPFNDHVPPPESVDIDNMYFGAGESFLIPGDVNVDGVVDVQDLVEVIAEWGPCLPNAVYCPEDLNCDDDIDVLDLITVILNWS